MGQVPRTRGVESTRAHKLAYRMPCSCRAEPGQDQEVQEAEDLQRDRGDHRDPGGSEGDVALSGLISPVQEAGQRQGAVARLVPGRGAGIAQRNEAVRT